MLLISLNSFSQTKILDSLKKEYYNKLDSLTASSYINNAYKGIEKSKDDFTDEITYRSDYLKPIGITKIIDKGVVSYYLSLRTNSDNVNFNIKGVYVLFTDGKKWIKLNEKINVHLDINFNYTAFIKLSASDLKLFQSKKINKFKLYIFEEEVGWSDSDKFILQTNIIQLLK